MRLSIAALLLAAAVAPALAQTPSVTTPSVTAPGVAAPGARPPPHDRMAARFAAANTTHDGRLTLAQAKDAKMPAVVRNFAAIDKDQKGYVTVDEVRAYRAQRRAQLNRPVTTN